MRVITDTYHKEVIERLSKHPKYVSESDRSIAEIAVLMFNGYDQKLSERTSDFLADIRDIRRGQ